MSRKTALLRVGMLMFGLVLGFVFGNGLNLFSPSRIREQRLSGYRYINPLLECETENASNVRELIYFKNKVEDYIDQTKENGKVKEAAVYFRDLNNGPWFGINEQEPFIPASLLKVPLMMSYHKLAESNPNILNTQIQSKPLESLFEKELLPQSKITPGQSYSVQELIHQMIVNSDNNAMYSLINTDYMNEEQFYKIFKDLNLYEFLIRGQEDSISVKLYASFYRMLYNASYLNKEYSEKSLKLLSETTFGEGIQKPIPKQSKLLINLD